MKQSLCLTQGLGQTTLNHVTIWCFSSRYHMDDMNSEVDCQAKGPRQGGDAEARVSQLGMG